MHYYKQQERLLFSYFHNWKYNRFYLENHKWAKQPFWLSFCFGVPLFNLDKKNQFFQLCGNSTDFIVGYMNWEWT